MPRFEFKKLVRDKIIDHQIKSGSKPKYRQLTRRQYKQALINKIIEEAEEILDANGDELASEIADVQQVIDDLVSELGLTKAQINKEQQLKNIKNGSFKKGIYIDYVDIPLGHDWETYYRQKYKELED